MAAPIKRRGVAAKRSLRAIGLAVGCWAIASCHQPIDTTRQAGPKATLGDDIYGLFCDRLGAGVLTEDLSGASYRGICHPDSKGNYDDTVKISLLPKVTGDKAVQARALSIAKMDALVRRRGDLVRALNAVLPDIDIDNVATDQQGDSVRLHDALMTFAQRITPLYDGDPYDQGGEPLLPGSTRALGRLFNALADSDAARTSLAKLWGRQGYRPFPVALGAVRPGIAYPGLRDMARATLAVLGPNGTALPELEQLLTVVKRELVTAQAVVAPLPNLVVDPATAQPNRPRTNIEVASSILLTEDPRFAAVGSDPPRYIVRRDRRGFAIPAGNQPGVPGTVPAPFADTDGDGFADVDGSGRFVDANGTPMQSLPFPFSVPGMTSGVFDSFGRPDNSPFQYIDTSRALTGAAARSLLPLVDPTAYGNADDPNTWTQDHESLMFAMAGAYLQYGDREPAVYDYASEAILPGETTCDGCVPYRRFRGEDSPVADLVHAAGQVLADEDSDAIILSLMDLVQNHEQVVARLVGAALRLREIAAQHDKVAQAGQEPFASIPYEAPLWDEMSAIIARIIQRPGLLEKLLGAIADDSIVQPFGGSQNFGQTLATLADMRDELTYDAFNINGAAINLTDGGSSTADPHNPVDRSAPLVNTNRSGLQHTLQLIHDSSKAKSCNKQGAKVYTTLGGISLEFPPLGSGYDQCELFSIANLGAFYLGSMLPITHPMRSEMVIKPGELQTLMNLIGVVTSPDNLLEQSSGIDGFTLHPSSTALNRFVFFGADSEQFPNMPDRDTFNSDSNTNKFIRDLQEPMAGQECPQGSNAVPVCGSEDDLLRLRDRGTIFLWERLGFYDYLRPMITVLANESCSADVSVCDTSDLSGLQLFLDINDVLYRHWPGKEHGAECNHTGTPQNNGKYCSEAGANTYEPILADSFRTDIIPALHEFAKVATQLSTITVQRGPKAGQVWTGAQVLEKLTQILFDPQYAASVGMVDRAGHPGTTWTDGTPKPQLTVFDLFADALHRIDVRFANACSCDGLVDPDLSACQADHDACRADADLRQGEWKRARSQFADAFLAVDGAGPDAKFHNPATPGMLLASMRVLREQLNANCPVREAGGGCNWAKTDLGQKMATTISGPLFAGIMDVQDAVRENEPARRQLESFLTYALTASSGDDALQALLASSSDIMQIITDDADMSPIFNAVANASSPDGTPADQGDGPGCADRTIRVMKALTSDEYDPYHVLSQILPLLVTPMDDGSGPTPLEIFIDTIAEVNRIDASSGEPLASDDYRNIMGSMNDFLTNETRGLEQFYDIIQSRSRE